MYTKWTARTILVAMSGCLTLAAPAHAVTCQYQGRPASVIRSSPGFGIAYGNFRLVNSPSTCPSNAQAIQFGSTSSANAATFVATIETCLDAATLLVVNKGRITFVMDDPTSGEPGVVIGNDREAPVALCRISR
ncbi:MAG TPA: hypothetical protein VGG03_08135 [Thermoanaerobaculia bacterium]|jgi:hypothetical protein